MALDIADPAALAAAVAFAEQVGCLDDLRAKLRWLDASDGPLTHCVMNAATPPYAFDFVIFEHGDATWRPVFVGRLAPAVPDGSDAAPTFAVSITSARGNNGHATKSA